MHWVLFDKELEMFFGGIIRGGSTIWHISPDKPNVRKYASAEEATAAATKLGLSERLCASPQPSPDLDGPSPV